MVFAAMTGRGVLPLIRLPSKVKINAKYYIEKVLKPLLETELPKLYPNDLHRVLVHHDLAPAVDSRVC